MKNPLIPLLWIILCTISACKNKDCANGDNVGGLCDCDSGYSRDVSGKCSIVSRDKFIGDYYVVQGCSSTSPHAFTVKITDGFIITDVEIANFWDSFGHHVIATVTGDTLNIARQEPDDDKLIVEGIGVYSTNANGIDIITLNYTVTDESSVPVTSDICTSITFTKQ